MTPELSADPKLAQLAVNTIRFLAVDAVEKSRSGHPGLPMGMADAGYMVWTRFMRHDPATRSGRDATASCCRPVTARCCCTRSCT